MAKTGRRNLAAAARQADALRLRKEGRTFEEIGAALGISRQAAHKAVSSALKAVTREPALELQALELERLDALTAAVWPAASSGDLPAVDRVLRLMERRAKLCALDGAHRANELPDSLRELTRAYTQSADKEDRPADAPKPDPHREALARLDALAELTYPAAVAGNLDAVGKLIEIARHRARLTGADSAPIDDGQPDNIMALVRVLERARSRAREENFAAGDQAETAGTEADHEPRCGATDETVA